MSIFNLFDRKKENPYFTKLKNLNLKQNFVNSIVQAYYLGGVVYNNENYKNIIQAVQERRLSEFFQNGSYDSKQDNIELYWVRDNQEHINIIVVFDPVELYENEEILKVIPSVDDFWNDISGAESIYP